MQAPSIIRIPFAVAMACLSLSACEPPETHGTLVDPPKPTPDFTLVSDRGPVTRAEFEGRLTVVFFGFTRCPDICPDTMVRLRQALALLGPAAADQVQVVLVSVDPEHDDPATVGRYARTFGERFLGLTGDPEEVAAMAAGYGIYHQRMPLGAGDYTVDHTAATTVLNRRGEAVLIWRYGLDPEEMAADLRYLLRR